MMESQRNRAILCLGSNRDAAENRARAADMLRARFRSVRFSPAVYTRPVGCPSEAPFLNQVAILTCEEEPNDLRCALKAIERAIGRCPEDKSNGSVPIDIDLLQWNDRVLKPDDLRRDYVIEGLRSLLSAGEEAEECR